MKVKLKCSGFADIRKVFRELAQQNIRVLDTRGDSLECIVTILVESRDKLSDLIRELNSVCYFSVSIVKVYKPKKCDTCEYDSSCSSFRKLFSWLCKEIEE